MLTLILGTEAVDLVVDRFLADAQAAGGHGLVAATGLDRALNDGALLLLQRNDLFRGSGGCPGRCESGWRGTLQPGESLRSAGEFPQAQMTLAVAYTGWMSGFMGAPR